MNIWIKEYQVKQDGAICRNCRHFYQHYVNIGGSFQKVEAGHCSYPRNKDRSPSDSCKYFEGWSRNGGDVSSGNHTEQ